VLATQIGAELLIVLTDVPEVYLDYGKDTQRPLTALTIKQTERWLEAGQFPAGSMGPKVSSILTFLKAGGKRGLITTPGHLEDALDGISGTHFVGRI
jgi:carbamate kinase